MEFEGSLTTIFEKPDLSFVPEYSCAYPTQTPELDLSTLSQAEYIYRDRLHFDLLKDIAIYYQLFCSAMPASEALLIAPCVDNISGSRFVEIHCEDDNSRVTVTFERILKSTSLTTAAIPYMVRCERYHAKKGEERVLRVVTNQMLRDQGGRLTTRGIDYLNAVVQFLTELEHIRKPSLQPNPHTGSTL